MIAWVSVVQDRICGLDNLKGGGGGGGDSLVIDSQMMTYVLSCQKSNTVCNNFRNTLTRTLIFHL